MKRHPPSKRSYGPRGIPQSLLQEFAALLKIVTDCDTATCSFCLRTLFEMISTANGPSRLQFPQLTGDFATQAVVEKGQIFQVLKF